MNAKLLLLLGLTWMIPSCARVAVEGGEKPIHIVMDINIRVDRELEQFFAFEEQYRAPAASQPTTALSQASDASAQSVTQETE